MWVRGCDHGGGRGQGRAGRWEHHAAGAGACRSTNPVIKRRYMLTGVLCDTRCCVGAAERCLLVPVLMGHAHCALMERLASTYCVCSWTSRAHMLGCGTQHTGVCLLWQKQGANAGLCWSIELGMCCSVLSRSASRPSPLPPYPTHPPLTWSIAPYPPAAAAR